MRTFWIFTTFIAIFILAVWMFAERVVQRTPELKQQPHITEVHGNHGDISLSDLKGKYVLVNFWDSHNAVSRIAAGEYDRFFRDNKHKNIQLLSVNTDDNLKLFNEIVRNDGLDSLTQFHIRNVKAQGIPSRRWIFLLSHQPCGQNHSSQPVDTDYKKNNQPIKFQ